MPTDLPELPLRAPAGTPGRLSRRALLGAAALLPAAAHAKRAAPGVTEAPELALATDERWWAPVQSAFSLDRTVVNLNNGGCCPTPRSVHEALLRYLDWSNQGPPLYMWQQLEPGVEAVRRELAREAGVDPEELAITRNASEALQIAQLGLELARGDEVVTTEQDYPRMLDTWAQRVRRDGIRLRRVALPVPGEDDAIVAAISAAFTERTRVLHICQVVNLSGRILPVRRLCEAARARGIVSIVDGAHAFAQFPFRIPDLGCDYYGTSLHKWLLAPVGTGFLWMRRERIAGHWALTPTSPSRDADIRKFEEIGTHPAANHDAVAEALVFHRGIGAALKAARLQHLRKRWTDALRGLPRIRLHTPDDPALACAIGTVGIDGADIPTVVGTLMARWRIVATPIVFAPRDPVDPEAPAGPVQFAGVRVTPNVYTTLDEIDLFAEAFASLARA